MKTNPFKSAENTLLELMKNSKNSFVKKTVKKMLDTMNGEINKKNDDIYKASYIAPRKVDISLAEYKALYKFNDGRGRKPDIYMFKGEYFKFSELCELFGLKYKMVYQRIRMGWSMVRVFGVESHRVDNFIADNLRMMEK